MSQHGAIPPAGQRWLYQLQSSSRSPAANKRLVCVGVCLLTVTLLNKRVYQKCDDNWIAPSVYAHERLICQGTERAKSNPRPGTESSRRENPDLRGIIIPNKNIPSRIGFASLNTLVPRWQVLLRYLDSLANDFLVF